MNKNRWYVKSLARQRGSVPNRSTADSFYKKALRRQVCSLVCASLLLSAAPVIQAATFYTSMSAVQWQVNRSVFKCSLSQQITGYGNAVFSRSAGEQELFYLQQKQILLPEGEAKIRLVSPAWSADDFEQLLFSAPVKADKIPLTLAHTFAQQLQTGLMGGLRVVVTGAQGGDGNPVHLVLEPLKFRSAQQDYVKCFNQLLPVSFAQVERTTLYFSLASDDLSESDIRKLKALVVYVKADSRVKHIFIDGHTDGVGERPENLNISQLRSEHIATFLQEAGISPEKITTRWHGERYPVASNKTIEGRQKNRRVTVRLDLSS